MRYSAYLIVILISSSVFAQNKPVEKRIFPAKRLQYNMPAIDGILNDSAWSYIEWQSGFTQQYPNEGSPPTKPTFVKIIYDENNLYIAFYCQDEKDKIIQRFSQRDQFSGDVIGLAFDSYYNQKTAYEFNVTSAGQKVDLMHTGDGNYDQSWNAVWDVKTSVADSGWYAEFMIPFSQLRYNNKQEYIWGLHIWRWIDRAKEESQWNLIPLNGPAGVHNFGKIEGISNIRSSRQAEILPYASFKYDHNGNNDNPYIKDGSFVPNAGVDAKIGISSDFTLDATINPDFGQVEADPAVLNLSAYETYFDEKRPFFLEGKEIFNFSLNGNNVFYSKRLGATPGYYPDVMDEEEYSHPKQTTIIGSAKVTGRTASGLSVGVLETVTSEENGIAYSTKLNGGGDDTIQTRKLTAEPLTNYFASRLKKEANHGNTVFGGTFNSVIRHLDTPEISDEFIGSAHTGGIDFMQYFKDKNYSLEAKVFASHLEGSEQSILKKQESHIHRFQRPDAKHLTVDSTRKSLTGSAAFLEAAKKGGKFRYAVNGSYWSPQLNFNDIGFMPGTDVIEQKNYCSFNQYEPEINVRNYHVYLSNTNKWTFGGEHTWTNLYSEFYMEFKNLWSLFVHSEIAHSYLDTRILRGGHALHVVGYQGGGFSINSNSAKRIYGNLNLVYYHDKNESRYYYAGLGFGTNPIDQLKINLNAYTEVNDFAYTYFVADFNEDTENTYMVGWMYQQSIGMTFRAEYYFSPELSLQYYGNPLISTVDYSDIMRVDNAGSHDINKQFYVYNSNEITFNEGENSYEVNEIIGSSYSFTNPDVSFGEFRSNFVLRWEYKLGSVFYLVWSHQQGKYDNINSPKLDHTLSELFQVPSSDVIMFKFSYWFNL